MIWNQTKFNANSSCARPLQIWKLGKGVHAHITFTRQDYQFRSYFLVFVCMKKIVAFECILLHLWLETLANLRLRSCFEDMEMIWSDCECWCYICSLCKWFQQMFSTRRGSRIRAGVCAQWISPHCVNMECLVAYPDVPHSQTLLTHRLCAMWTVSVLVKLDCQCTE